MSRLLVEYKISKKPLSTAKIAHIFDLPGQTNDDNFQAYSISSNGSLIASVYETTEYFRVFLNVVDKDKHNGECRHLFDDIRLVP